MEATKLKVKTRRDLLKMQIYTIQKHHFQKKIT